MVLLGEKEDLDVIPWSMGTHRRVLNSGTIGSALQFFLKHKSRCICKNKQQKLIKVTQLLFLKYTV